MARAASSWHRSESERAHPRRCSPGYSRVAAWTTCTCATPKLGASWRASRRLALRPFSDPVARSRSQSCRAVGRIGELAAAERETAAADAFRKPGLQALELRDALVDTRGPASREARPVPPGRRALRRQLGELCADLLERQADPLGEDDERDAPQRRPREAPVPGARALGLDEAALLVEAQRRSGDAAAARNLLNGQQVVHGASLAHPALDFKFT